MSYRSKATCQYQCLCHPHETQTLRVHEQAGDGLTLCGTLLPVHGKHRMVLVSLGPGTVDCRRCESTGGLPG